MQKTSGYLFLRGKIWYIAYPDPTAKGGIGRESSKSKKKGDAQNLLDQRLEVIRNNIYGFKETNASYVQHFKDFLDLYKIGTQTHKSYKGVLKLFLEFLGDKYPAIQYLHEFTATPKLFSDYKLWLKRDRFTPQGTPHKDWTIKNHLKVIKTAFIQAKEWKLISDVPTIDCNISIQDRKLIVTLSKEDDFNLFFKRCEKLKPEYYPHYFVTARTGLRFGEMCSLLWENVDLKVGYIIIKSHKDFMPKGRQKKTGLAKERPIPLTKDTIEILKALPRSDKYNNVFLKDGKPIDPKDKSFRRWLLVIVRGTRLDGMTRFHELRHTVGQLLADKGVDRSVIKDFLGHSDIRTTEIYVGKPVRPLLEASKKLEGFGK